jgi:hypothetical protein
VGIVCGVCALIFIVAIGLLISKKKSWFARCRRRERKLNRFKIDVMSLQGAFLRIVSHFVAGDGERVHVSSQHELNSTILRTFRGRLHGAFSTPG